MQPTLKQIIEAITDRRRSSFPTRVFNVLNDGFDPGCDGIKQASAEIGQLISGKCIVFSGPVGSGKTITAAFMACHFLWCSNLLHVYEALKADPAVKAVGSSDEKIFDEIMGGKIPRFMWSNSQDILSLDWHWSDYNGLLIIENLGREHFTDKGFGHARWDDFFDLRYREYLPTIITTNLTPDMFEARYGGHNLSRLREWGCWFEIKEEDMR